MASLTFSTPINNGHLIFRSHFQNSGIHKARHPNHKVTFFNRLKTPPLRCTKLFPFEGSSPYNPIDDENSIIKRSNTVDPIDSEDPPKFSSVQDEADGVFDMKREPTLQQQQPVKWPMWLLGPSVLLVTGMLPTLWLPLSSVFVGPNIAGLLSIVGLDCLFNMGATLFLLMADFCAQPKGGRNPTEDISQVPLNYRLWNSGASVVGFLIPLLMFFISHKRYFQPQVPFISFAVLLGPYLLLLSTQVLTEMLTWHWKSPAWLLTPIVYEGYRILQLMRGLQLGVEIGAPGWVVESIRGLVSWWVLVLGIQLMRVAWFAGLDLRSHNQRSQVI